MSFFSNFAGSVQAIAHQSNDPLIQSVLKINGNSFRLTRLLGEGGFSYIYLAQNQRNAEYAVKVIKCNNRETTDRAIREGILLSRFNHKNIIKVEDVCIIKEESGLRLLYMVLPYYKKGSLQDWISGDRENQLQLEDAMSIFKQICLAVKALTEHEERGEIVPWAHRDIKPANILLSDDGKDIVLMDFGSAQKARIEIKSKKMAQQIQDEAAEHCSMPYRAPELFDVCAHPRIDEKVDIWSLGCTLYTMIYGENPFERTIRSGGSIALAIMNGQYSFPGHTNLLIQRLISSMLEVQPQRRPNIQSVLQCISELGFK
ncbi:kinase-like domain-containing protein [Sporodiniella umbellata]|nr:kinase-like domain-containing protein [Sporodiniella umbellata]